MYGKKPTFIYIGPDKAGSTWIFNVLAWHPEVYVTPAKDLYYFDKYYHRGMDWYLGHFKDAQNERVIVEISHDYLYSAKAAERIYESLDNVKLMVNLREPVDRAHSAYLYLKKHGICTDTFEEALQKFPEIIYRGDYAKYLEPYIKRFGPERIFIGVFDELKSDPNAFAKKLFEFLGVENIDLPKDLLGKTLPASRPRSILLAKLIKKAALVARENGFEELVGRIKTSPIVQRILYKPYTERDKPAPSQETVQKLREYYSPKIEKLDLLLGTNFQELWNYK